MLLEGSECSWAVGRGCKGGGRSDRGGLSILIDNQLSSVDRCKITTMPAGGTGRDMASVVVCVGWLI